jgi:homoserine dehydrogenase
MTTFALLGRGHVGSNLIRMMLDSGYDLKTVGVLNDDKPNIYPVAVTTDIDSILEDETIDALIEAIPNDIESFEYVTKALISGKTVITCNKKLVSRYIDDLGKIADSVGSVIYLDSITAPLEIIDGGLTHKNISKFKHDELYCFRGGGGLETAEAIMRDVGRVSLL